MYVNSHIFSLNTQLLLFRECESCWFVFRWNFADFFFLSRLTKYYFPFIRKYYENESGSEDFNLTEHRNKLGNIRFGLQKMLKFMAFKLRNREEILSFKLVNWIFRAMIFPKLWVQSSVSDEFVCEKSLLNWDVF